MISASTEINGKTISICVGEDGSILIDCAQANNLIGTRFFFDKIWLTPWDLLSVWQRCFYEEIDCSALSTLVARVEAILPERDREAFQWLKIAVVSEMAWTTQCQSSEFGRVHKWARNSLPSLIAGSKVVKAPSKNGCRPDLFLEIEGATYPVECKLDFNEAGLKQLQRYMKAYQVRRGFAVAPKLSCPIPSNVEFIQCP